MSTFTLVTLKVQREGLPKIYRQKFNIIFRIVFSSFPLDRTFCLFFASFTVAVGFHARMFGGGE